MELGYLLLYSLHLLNASNETTYFIQKIKIKEDCLDKSFTQQTGKQYPLSEEFGILFIDVEHVCICLYLVVVSYDS